MTLYYFFPYFLSLKSHQSHQSYLKISYLYLQIVADYERDGISFTCNFYFAIKNDKMSAYILAKNSWHMVLNPFSFAVLSIHFPDKSVLFSSSSTAL